MTDRPRRVRELFDAAAELPRHEVRAYLDAASGGDRRLRQEVEALLDALDGADGFLDDEPEAERVGDRVGRYELVERIGEGGHGTVWRARQLEPVRRDVALKLVKLGMDTRQVVSRFESERQLLAWMDHPSIARVYDAGATAAGRPYFAMELVGGEPITDYCDRRELDIRARLRLFRQVCDAVQHAHHKGVVHRDVKPSNVLVVEHDGRPLVKVIDFGIAKALAPGFGADTLVTGAAQVLGTPNYMAPEQASMATDVDTRADVYALGVMLYVLLCGEKPFDFRACAQLGYDWVLRTIREAEPPRPSQRLGDDAALEVALRRRHGSLESLRRALRGDLDWIVMRALAKDRDARYAAASALGDDVERHLEGLPVEAGPPSAAYRLRKLVLRHQRAVALAAALLLALLGGLAGVLVALDRARGAERTADLARRAAERETTRAQVAERRARDEAEHASRQARIAAETLDLVREVLAASRIGSPRGPDFTLAELLGDLSATLDGRYRDAPEIELDLRGSIGAALRTLGRYDAARREFDRVAELLAEAARPTAVASRARVQRAWLLHDLGLHRDAAVEALRAEREVRDALAERPDDEGMRRLLVDALHLRAGLAGHLGRAVDGWRLGTEALAAAPADDPAARLPILHTLTSIARDLDRLDDAIALVEQSRAEMARLGRDDPLEIGYLLLLEAGLALDRSRLDEADRAALAARERFTAVVGERPHPLLARSATTLGRIALARGAADEAIAHFDAALAIHCEVHGAAHRDAVQARVDRANALRHADRRAEAIAEFEAVLPDYAAIHGARSGPVASLCTRLGLTSMAGGQHAEAVEPLRRAAAIYAERFGPEHRWTTMSRVNLARVLRATGAHQELAALCAGGIADAARFGPVPVASLGVEWLRALRALGRSDAVAGAVVAVESGLGGRLDEVPASLRAWWRHLRGVVALEGGDAAAAVAVLERARADWSEVPRPDPHFVWDSSIALGRALLATGRREEAAALLDEVWAAAEPHASHGCATLLALLDALLAAHDGGSGPEIAAWRAWRERLRPERR